MVNYAIPRRNHGAVINVIQGMVIGTILTTLSYVVGMQFGWLDVLNPLEVFAVFTSYACTFLCVMERRINYPIGVITTAAYSTLFWQWGLPASSAVNAFLAIYLAYGWIRWRDDANTRPVTRMTPLAWGVSIAVALVSYAVVVFISDALGGTLPLADSVIMVGTILAQFMLDNKQRANWAIWAVVNVFAIYTYFNAGLALAGFQYIFFLLNTAFGYYTWTESMNSERSLGFDDGTSTDERPSESDSVRL